MSLTIVAAVSFLAVILLILWFITANAREERAKARWNWRADHAEIVEETSYRPSLTSSSDGVEMLYLYDSGGTIFDGPSGYDGSTSYDCGSSFDGGGMCD